MRRFTLQIAKGAKKKKRRRKAKVPSTVPVSHGMRDVLDRVEIPGCPGGHCTSAPEVTHIESRMHERGQVELTLEAVCTGGCNAHATYSAVLRHDDTERVIARLEKLEYHHHHSVPYLGQSGRFGRGF